MPRHFQPMQITLFMILLLTMMMIGRYGCQSLEFARLGIRKNPKEFSEESVHHFHDSSTTSSKFQDSHRHTQTHRQRHTHTHTHTHTNTHTHNQGLTSPSHSIYNRDHSASSQKLNNQSTRLFFKDTGQNYIRTQRGAP